MRIELLKIIRFAETKNDEKKEERSFIQKHDDLMGCTPVLSEEPDQDPWSRS
jgi:hypothetical protein